MGLLMVLAVSFIVTGALLGLLTLPADHLELASRLVHLGCVLPFILGGAYYAWVRYRLGARDEKDD
jgi:hypothetical protein